MMARSSSNLMPNRLNQMIFQPRKTVIQIFFVLSSQDSLSH